MEVESTYGQGSTFTVYIPVGNGHLPHDQLQDSELLDTENFTIREYGRSVIEEADRWGQLILSDTISAELSAARSKPTNSQLLPYDSILPPPHRILVVDDNEDMRMYVKEILSPFYQVMEASNGRDAMAIMALKGIPDVILSDIMGVDGYGNFPLNYLTVRIA
jgi:hypothetical protein